jgi:hypothetical protein
VKREVKINGNLYKKTNFQYLTFLSGAEKRVKGRTFMGLKCGCAGVIQKNFDQKGGLVKVVFSRSWFL